MHVGGEPGKGRQAAEAVTVEEGQGADIRAQRGHGAHSSPSPANRRKGRRWPPTPALTDGAAPRRSPPRRFKPHQLASHGTGWTFLQSKGFSRVFSNTTVQKHQFFGAQLSLTKNGTRPCKELILLYDVSQDGQVTCLSFQ